LDLPIKNSFIKTARPHDRKTFFNSQVLKITNDELRIKNDLS